MTDARPPRVAVIGAGLMGVGIAQVFAAAGHAVALHDADPEVLASAPSRLRGIFELLGQEPTGADRVASAGSIAEAAQGAELAVEAVYENLELKQDVLAALEAALSESGIIATNTSALPVTDVGARVADGGRVVGTHFWNPPWGVRLVEVVQAERTAPATVERTIALLERVGMKPVHVKRDLPGFVGNRLQHALKREAIALVAAGVCDAETIDTVTKEGFGPRLAVLGPLEQSDLVGLDLTLAIHETLMPVLDVTREPHPYLVGKVAQGDLGMKTGRGFREWTPEQADTVRERLARYLADGARERGGRRP